MSAADYIRGRRLSVGERLGEKTNAQRLFLLRRCFYAIRSFLG